LSIELFNIENGYTVFSKGNYETRRHAHYAIEIVFAVDGCFKVITGLSQHVNLKSVIIPSNLPHSFSCIGATCNLLFLDPLSDIGVYFLHQYRLNSANGLIANPAGLSRFHRNGKFDIPSLMEAAKTNGGLPLDERVAICIQMISSPDNEEKLTLGQLSKASFLSESRLSHLFKEQLGISVHQCILWKKMLLAVLKSREGYSLTECAHYAGFSDSSHFNKVFYKMFGIKPFFVLKD
jgi:AraC-like DNA-binding protein